MIIIIMLNSIKWYNGIGNHWKSTLKLFWKSIFGPNFKKLSSDAVGNSQYILVYKGAQLLSSNRLINSISTW